MADRRATLPRQFGYAKAFLKDWSRLARTSRYDMGRLKQVMPRLLANDGPLGPEWRDHPLKGGWAGHRECHVGGEFLLIYKLDENFGEHGGVVFVRAGTHSELFDE